MLLMTELTECPERGSIDHNDDCDICLGSGYVDDDEDDEMVIA